MTDKELMEIQVRCERAIILTDELHTERLEYYEYLTLRDSIDDIGSLIIEYKRLQAENQSLDQQCDELRKSGAVKVVRCKDCKKNSDCKTLKPYVTEDYYCAFGEAREGQA